jgi:hypothetical protein
MSYNVVQERHMMRINFLPQDKLLGYNHADLGMIGDFYVDYIEGELKGQNWCAYGKFIPLICDNIDNTCVLHFCLEPEYAIKIDGTQSAKDIFWCPWINWRLEYK